MRGINCDWCSKKMKAKIEKILDKHGVEITARCYVELTEPEEGFPNQLYLDGGFTLAEMQCLTEIMEMVNGGKK